MTDILDKTEVRPCESRICGGSEQILFTRLEGTGTAVIFYDPKNRIGGLLVYQLPSSQDDANSARVHQFADTGIEKTLFSLMEAGAEWDRLIIKLCGAAILGKDENQDAVSRRNVLAARKVFWKLGLFIHNQDVGGNQTRDLFFNPADGIVTVRSGDSEKKI